MKNCIKSATAFFSLAMISILFVSNGHGANALYRQIPIPKEEHGYGEIRSRILKSETDFQNFLKESDKKVWNERKKFVDTLNAAKTDFATESLLLLFVSEGSGSVRIGEPIAKLKGTTLLISVSRDLPDGYGTADMAYYGFSYAVKKKAIKEVSLSVGKIQLFSMKIQD